MNLSTDSAVQITAYLRAGMSARPGVARVGPFLAGFDAESDNRFRNYAVPDDGCAPGETDIRSLIELFAARGRLPRLEYVPALAPGVLPALTEAGFTAEGELPLMVCAPVAFREPVLPADIALAVVTTAFDIAAAARVQNEAYGESAPTEADVARLRRVTERGGAVALARVKSSGEAVGSGLYAAPLHAATEIAAVGVRAPFRRRGIAAAITALLTGDALGRRLTPFLMAAHDAEARIYSRIGYQRCATMLHISRPSSTSTT
jgi:hypothetical protein